MRPFTTEELMAFHDNLADILASSGEAAASKYLGQNMSRLPDDMRKEILARIFFEEVAQEAREIESIATAQEQSLAALAALEVLEAELKEGS